MKEDMLNDDAVMAERLERIGHAFVVLSGKGGVGKSTVSVNLALSLAMKGFKTGLLDVDIHGPSIPTLLGIKGRYPVVKDNEIEPIECYGNLKVMSMGFLLGGTDTPVIWRGPMKANVIKEFLKGVAWGELDFLVVDSPPGTGDEPLSIAQYLKGKASAVIVTTPQNVATIDVEKCIIFCREVNLPVAGIVENMSGFVCPHCGKKTEIFSSGGGMELSSRFHVPYLGGIPIDPKIVMSGDEGKPFLQLYPETETARTFNMIIESIIKGLDPSAQKEENIKETKTKEKEEHMRFAVPTSEGKLCAHFGHCEAFAIIDTDGGGRIVKEVYETPPPHEPGVLPEWLSKMGVDCVIAGGMGSRAQQLFAEKGVKVVTGAIGEDPRVVVEAYLKGTLQTGQNTCDHDH